MLLEEVDKVGPPIGNAQIYAQRREQEGAVAVVLLVGRADLLRSYTRSFELPREC